MVLLIISLLASASFIWAFVVFSIFKQFRYATKITDLLPYYKYLTLLALFLYIGAILIWLSWPLDIFMVMISIIFISLLLYEILSWESNYRVSSYKDLLIELQKPKYEVMSFSDYLHKEKLSKNKIRVLLRHDVDLFLKRSKRMAKLEIEHNIKSTYLFRLHSEKYGFEQAIPFIENLNELGFEIGFHYEVLSQTKGDVRNAVSLFEKELNFLRSYAPIFICAAHGDKYKNRQIWDKLNSDSLKIHSAYEMHSDSYISDAGGGNITKKRYGKTIKEKLQEVNIGNTVQILIHPDWWY